QSAHGRGAKMQQGDDRERRQCRQAAQDCPPCGLYAMFRIDLIFAPWLWITFQPSPDNFSNAPLRFTLQVNEKKLFKDASDTVSGSKANAFWTANWCFSTQM